MHFGLRVFKKTSPNGKVIPDPMSVTSSVIFILSRLPPTWESAISSTGAIVSI
jgi:hypothetical protein